MVKIQFTDVLKLLIQSLLVGTILALLSLFILTHSIPGFIFN